jgi:hypothetical protein
MTHMGTTKTKTQKSSKAKEDAKELTALLEKAMQRPGVKEVMEVYGEWEKTNDAAQIFQAYQNPYPPSSVTSYSEPA